MHSEQNALRELTRPFLSPAPKKKERIGSGRLRETRVYTGAKVVVVDFPSSSGAAVADELGDSVSFVPTDMSEIAGPCKLFSLIT